MCQLKHFHCALVDVCQYTLNTSINRETRQTLEHHQTSYSSSSTASLPQQVHGRQLHTLSASTDQSSRWPSGLRVPGNVQIFRCLPTHWYLESASLILEKVEMALFGLCWCTLFLQGTKEEVQCNTTRWWPERGELLCMTSTCLHTTVARSPCTPGFPPSGLPKLALSPSRFPHTCKGWVKVWSKGSPLTLYLRCQYGSVHSQSLGTDSALPGTEPLP